MRIFIKSNIRQKIKQVIEERKTLLNRIRAAIFNEAQEIVRNAQENISGKVLNVGKGLLRRSVKVSPASVTGHLVRIVFGVAPGSAAAMYGAAWEEGYDVKAMRITPRQAKALSFIWHRLGKQGARSFTTGASLVGKYAGDPRSIFKAVNRPAYHVAARPWMGPAVAVQLPRTMKVLERVGIRLNKG